MYVYGTWLVWLLELIWCQLFAGLGAPVAQLQRRTGVFRGALRRLKLSCCGWQLSYAGSPGDAQPTLPVTAQQQAPESSAATNQPDAKPAPQPGKDAQQVEKDEASAAAEQQQPAGKLAKMNLSDALSGGYQFRQLYGVSLSVSPDLALHLHNTAYIAACKCVAQCCSGAAGQQLDAGGVARGGGAAARGRKGDGLPPAALAVGGSRQVNSPL